MAGGNPPSEKVRPYPEESKKGDSAESSDNGGRRASSNNRSSYLLLIIPLILIVLGQSSAKLAGTSTAGRLSIFFGLATYFFFALRGFVWAIILKRMKLSVAYPVLSLSFPLVLLVSFFVFGETVSIYNILGACLIAGGLVLISRGELLLSRMYTGDMYTGEQTKERTGRGSLRGKK